MSSIIIMDIFASQTLKSGFWVSSLIVRLLQCSSSLSKTVFVRRGGVVSLLLTLSDGVNRVSPRVGVFHLQAGCLPGWVSFTYRQGVSQGGCL